MADLENSIKIKSVFSVSKSDNPAIFKVLGFGPGSDDINSIPGDNTCNGHTFSDSFVKVEIMDPELTSYLSDSMPDVINAELFYDELKCEPESEGSSIHASPVLDDAPSTKQKSVKIENVFSEADNVKLDAFSMAEYNSNFVPGSDDFSMLYSNVSPVNSFNLSNFAVKTAYFDPGWMSRSDNVLTTNNLMTANNLNAGQCYDEPTQRYGFSTGSELLIQNEYNSNINHLTNKQTFKNSQSFAPDPIATNQSNKNNSPLCQSVTSQVTPQQINRQSSGEPSFPCRECSRIFKSKSSLKVHVKRKHDHDKPFRCSKCPYSTSCNILLTRHLLIHSDRLPFKCTHCDAQFDFETDLIKHGTLVHTTSRNYKCSQCPYDATRKGDLGRHMLVHSKIQSYHCSECGAKFKHISNMKKHVRRQHPGSKEFRCEHCAFYAFSESDLSEHELIHGKAFPYSCVECICKYKSKKALKCHIKEQHSQDSIAVIPVCDVIRSDTLRHKDCRLSCCQAPSDASLLLT